jgi:excisionase family DNA binding protein
METLMRLQKQNRLTSPRGLRADDAAAYLGVGKTKFLELVDRGTLPRAVTIDSMRIWDRFDLDAAFENLKEQEGARRGNPIEEHYGISGER